jgi:hypothetical protein
MLWGELANWRASHRGLGSAAGASEVIVVLGYRNSGARANALNRWRVRAGLRSQNPLATTTKVVLCGGSVKGTATEAELMAQYARNSCGYRGELILEDRSHSTWENIRNSIPFMEPADCVKIVSNPLHAEKGRMYLARQRPDLAVRLSRGADYRFGEWQPVKALLAPYETWMLRRARKG